MTCVIDHVHEHHVDLMANMNEKNNSHIKKLVEEFVRGDRHTHSHSHSHGDHTE